jgi:hypothetical protein
MPLVGGRGGPVLATPRFVPVTFADDPERPSIEAFMAAFGSGAYWSAVTAEYGVHAATAAPPIHETDAPGVSVDDAAVQDFLRARLDGTNAAYGTADPNAVYVLFYPPGTTLALDGIQSCTSFYGYHQELAVGAVRIAYAVVARCPSFFGATGFDAISAATAHELAEAATDPHPVSEPAFHVVAQEDAAWTILFGGSETADLCSQIAAPFVVDSGFTLPRMWSNTAARGGHDPCAPSADVYFAAAPVMPDTISVTFKGVVYAARGVRLPAGTARTVDVALFSDGPTGGPWTIAAIDDATVKGQASALEFSFDRTSGQNGDHVSMTVNRVPGTVGPLPFLVQSKLGDRVNFWAGVAGD